ncbi:signal peptidase I [Anaerolentibacter hominis]|uniref:signal peptidase I n=1 Tax=Anaerolentibacter hominis TaxID=3079009 RepID=UPI0031B847CE
MEETKQKKQHSVAGTIISILLCVILIPVIIVNLTLIIKTYTRPDEIPDFLGIKPVICLSGSMEPTFNTGDLILIKSVDTDSLKAGDVICYQVSGQAVTHRIKEIVQEEGQTRYVTQGDNNNTTDSTTVAPEDVEGTYMGVHLAGLGNFAMFMQSTTGMIVFIVLPLLLFVLWDVLRHRLNGKKELKRTEELEAELAALKAQKENQPGENQIHQA